VIERAHDQHVATQLSVLANRRGQRESPLLVKLDVRGVRRPVANLLAFDGSAGAALFEALIALARELPRRPQGDAPFSIGAEVAATFELDAKFRGQDESTLGVQRVLVLATNPSIDVPPMGSPLSPFRDTLHHLTPLECKSRQFGANFRFRDATIHQGGFVERAELRVKRKCAVLPGPLER